jgi:hypothetical protein
MPNRSLVPRWFAVAGVVLCGAFAFSTAPALADDADDALPVKAVSQTTGGSQAECQDPLLVQPFAPFGDFRDYVLVPGGEFSDPSGAGWQLRGGAKIVTASQHGGTPGSVLDLPGGAVAVSPTVCVDLNYPTARLWSRSVRGGGFVAVAVAYQETRTQYRPRLVDVLQSRGLGWTLSRDIRIRPQLAGRDSGWRRVAFVFAAVGGRSSEFQLDDLYVDPRMSR